MKIVKEFTEYPAIHRIFSQIYEEEDVAFLDSSLQNQLGQYSIIGRRPYLKLVKGECFTVNGIETDASFEEYVKSYLHMNQEENPWDLPLTSGAIGYFSYDYGREKEGVRAHCRKDVDIPDVILVFYDQFIIEDHRAGKLYLIANDHNQSCEEGMAELEALLTMDKRTVPLSALSDISSGKVTANFTKNDYMDAVQRMIQYIIEGDVYIANLTQQLQIYSEISPYDLFVKLREDNPSPFGGYFNYRDFQIVSASPERFLQMRNRRIQTRPIKGTRKRGATQEEDQTLRKELQESGKDQSELLMIVDLERNDLNRVCVPGSVEVEELFEVEAYATVFHLVSNVVGQLRPELNVMDLIQSAFPGGSITGAPKLRAMEIIDELEHSRRNLYTGSIGYLSLDGDCDLNIVIRTAIYWNNTYYLGVGGGITCESDLEFEYEETLQKAKALVEAALPEMSDSGTVLLSGESDGADMPDKRTVPLSAASLSVQMDEGYQFGLGVFETIAVENGVPQLLEWHLERMRHSLEVLGIEQQVTKESVFQYLAEQECSHHALKIMASDKNLIYTLRPNHYTAEQYKKGFVLKYSEVYRNETSLLVRHKTMNYGDCILEKRKAKSLGADELIFVNSKREICEGTTTNIFFTKDGEIFTPPVSCGLLPGVMRRYVMEKYNVTERIIRKEDVEKMDGCFVTNSLMGIMPVTKLEDISFTSCCHIWDTDMAENYRFQ